MKRFTLRFLIAMVWAQGIWAQTALPEPPDPREVVRLSPEQRMMQARSLHQALQQATPQERLEYKAKAREKMKALSPQERREVHEQMHADWSAMSEAQKKEMRDMRRSWVNQMSPEEREAMRQERRRMHEQMTPEERKKWREDMHRMRHDPAGTGAQHEHDRHATGHRPWGQHALGLPHPDRHQHGSQAMPEHGSNGPEVRQ